jgi:hypothetical protein
MTIAIGQGLGEDEGVQSPESVCRKRSRWMSHPAAHAEGKKRKKRLRRSSGLELDADPTTSILGGGPTSTNLEDDIGGYDGVRVGGRVLDEDEEEEEEEIPLIRKNSHSSRSSDILMQALSGLVSLQGLTMSAIDHALEEIIPEDLLSEPPEVESSVARAEVPDDIPLAAGPIEQEVAWTISHALSTLEGGLAHEDMLALDVAGQGHPAPLGMTEGASACEGAAKDNSAHEDGAEDDPAPKGGAEDDPAPKGAEPGSSSAASMDVDVGSPPIQSEEPVVMNLSTALVGLVTLEASDPDAGNPPPAIEAEVSPSDALNIVPVNAPSTDSASMLPALGLPLFLSNLQVSQPLLLIIYVDKRVLLLTFEIAECLQHCICPAEILWCPCPDQVLSLMQ